MKRAMLFLLMFMAGLIGGTFAIFYGQWVVGETIEYAMEKIND